MLVAGLVNAFVCGAELAFRPEGDAALAGTDEEKTAHLETACALYRGPPDESSAATGCWSTANLPRRPHRSRSRLGDPQYPAGPRSVQPGSG